MKNKIIIVILMMTVMLSSITTLHAIEGTTINQVSVTDDNNLFAGGSGTDENPYQISNAEEFNNIRTNLEASYVLINDIDMSNISDWEPIGTYENQFHGVFDGKNHSIFGLTITDTKYSDGAEYISLFGFCSKKWKKTSIKNLNIENVTIKINNKEGQVNLGVIANQASCSISNCHVSGGISVSDSYNVSVGGITNYAGSTIDSCTSNITMNIESNRVDDRNYHGGITCGGIIGWGGDINNCINYGSINIISGNFIQCGGIVGEGGNVINCVNYGDINGKAMYYDLYTNGQYNCEIGGIVGSYSRKIQGCVNYGNIDGYAPEGVTCNIAGIFGGGSWMSYCSSLTNCFNMGKVINSSNYIERIGFAQEMENNYSLDTTLLNGMIPTEYIGIDQCNGKSLDYNDMCQMMKEKLNYEVADNIKNVVGEIKSIDFNNFTINIDNQIYPVSDFFELNIAVDILNNHSSKVVVATLVNGLVETLVDVKEVIFPKIKVSLDKNELKYENGKINPLKIKGKVTVIWAVKNPYKISDFYLVKDNSSASITIDDVSLKVYDYGMYFEKGSWSDHNKTDINISANTSLKPGEAKDFSFYVYVEDNYKPTNINETLTMEGSTVVDSQTYKNTLHLPVGNIDLQKEVADEKKAKRESTQNVNKAIKTLEGLNFVVDQTRLSEYFSSSTRKDINKCVSLWVSNLIASANLVHNDNNGIIDTIRKKTGLSNKDIISSVMKKLGVNENVLTTFTNTKATTEVVANGKDGKKYTIYFSVDLGFNAFNDSCPYTGYGTVDYYVMDNGRKIKSIANGMITYTNISTFASQLENIAENTIKSAYSDVWGRNANKVATLLVGDTISKVLDKKIGTFSNNIFNLLKTPTKQYTKKISVHCPVDVYVYDATGNICGEIINNKVDSQYNQLFMYADGDEKYVYLPNDDYTLCFVGNDTGEMKYTIEEYTGTETLRNIVYYKIPLSKNIKYYSIVPDSLYLDNAIYNPVTDSCEEISVNIDSWQDNLSEKIAVSDIELNQLILELSYGDEYQLTAKVFPSNASINIVDWTSIDERIAVVTDDGLVKAVGSGTTIIQARSVDGGIVTECKINISRLGDINGDNEINYRDAVLVLQNDSGAITLTENQLKAANVNGDNVVDYNDAVQILKFDAGNITEFK